MADVAAVPPEDVALGPSISEEPEAQEVVDNVPVAEDEELASTREDEYLEGFDADVTVIAEEDEDEALDVSCEKETAGPVEEHLEDLFGDETTEVHPSVAAAAAALAAHQLAEEQAEVVTEDDHLSVVSLDFHDEYCETELELEYSDADTYDDDDPREAYEHFCRTHDIPPLRVYTDQCQEPCIRLHYVPVNLLQAQGLAAAFAVAHSLTALDLQDCQLKDAGLSAILHALQDHNALCYLDISWNSIRSGAVSALTDLLASRASLQTLKIAGCGLNDAHIESLAEPLSDHSSLRHLDLSNNQFGDHCGKALAQITNSDLVYLDLSWNQLRDRTAIETVHSLRNSVTLKVVKLDWNGLADSGGLAVADCVRNNSTIEELSVRANRISRDAADAIASVLKSNTSLHRLDLSLNPINLNVVDTLFASMKTNRNLQSVLLEKVPISFELRAQLKKMVTPSEKLSSLRNELATSEAENIKLHQEQCCLKHWTALEKSLEDLGSSKNELRSAVVQLLQQCVQSVRLSHSATEATAAHKEAEELWQGLLNLLEQLPTGTAVRDFCKLQRKMDPLATASSVKLLQPRLQSLARAAEREAAQKAYRRPETFGTMPEKTVVQEDLSEQDELHDLVEHGVELAKQHEAGLALWFASMAYVQAGTVNHQAQAADIEAKETYASAMGLSLEDDVVALPEGTHELSACILAVEAVQRAVEEHVRSRSLEDDSQALQTLVRKCLIDHAHGQLNVEELTSILVALGKARYRANHAGKQYVQNVEQRVRTMSDKVVQLRNDADETLEADMDEGLRPDLEVVVDDHTGGDFVGKDPWRVVEEFIERHKLRLADLFRRFDKDGNGTLSPTEIRQGIAESGMQLAPEQIEDMIEELDRDGDGNVDYREMDVTRRIRKTKMANEFYQKVGKLQATPFGDNSVVQDIMKTMASDIVGVTGGGIHLRRRSSVAS